MTGRRAAAARSGLAATAALAALTGVALTGCETTADKSARLEREADRHATGLSTTGLTIAHPSRTLNVREAVLVGSSEATAAVVTIHNAGPSPAHDVPIAITAKGAGSATVYTNATPGLARSLAYATYIPAGGELVWVDDQLPTSAAHASLTATVGEAPTAAAPPPTLAVSGTRPFEDPTNGVGLEGRVSNGSRVAQQQLVVFAIARTAHRIAAAGRAVIPELGAHASARFQVFWVGNPAGARVQVFAPPSTLR